MCRQIVTAVCAYGELDEVVNHEYDAHPELETHVGVVFEEVYTPESVDRDEDDEQY